jgi:flavin reductase (DIM6/NTAB) family NADH-FMN oxidoreductase RutF
MEFKYNKYLEDTMNQLENKGVFLTVKNKEDLNTMTIGWGFVGVMWNKPVFIAAVRYSRYTYEMLKNTDNFTVSIPLKGQMDKELIKCGTESGRDVDKFDKYNIETIKSEKVNTPIIKECDLHYECKIIYRQTLEAELINNEDIKNKYKNNDYHVMVYGEILSFHN